MASSITITPEDCKTLRLSKSATVSIKYDGIQGRWDGKGRLETKSGVRIAAPQWFLDRLPKFPATGELWMGDGKFQECQSVVLSANESEEWRKVKFGIFEASEEVKESETVFPIIKFQGMTAQEIHCFAEVTILTGGEGLVIMDRGIMIKVKPREDKEGRIIGYNKSGSLHIESEGKRFFLSSGLTEEIKNNPPAIGELVTFSFIGTTKSGVPRFPSFLRVRSENA